MVLEQGEKYVTALVVLLLGGCLWWWRQFRGLVVALGVLVAGLLPVLGVVPFIFQFYSTVADRYAYLALVGPALGLGWGVQWLGRHRLVWLGNLLLLGVLGWHSTAQVQIWRDTTTLFTHTLRLNPQSAVAHNNVGLTLVSQGKLDEAAMHLQTAVQLKPRLPEPHHNLGRVLRLQGKLDEAIAQFKTVLQFDPNSAEAHNVLGDTLTQQGEDAAAILHYTQALLLRPDWDGVHTKLGHAIMRQQHGAAQEQFIYDMP
jgi:tetratricopeptide (TPR) repeat protein